MDSNASIVTFIRELEELGFSAITEIGRGGMGIVFKAIQRRLGRVVAIKAISAQGASDRITRQRFIVEMRILANLSHPGIVTMYDGNVTPSGIPYYYMSFIEGRNLAEAIAARTRPYTITEAVKMLRPIASALDYLHQRPSPIIHRDIKPANILRADDAALLSDFGISIAPEHTRMTAEGFTLGTDTYMAPELFRAGSFSNGSAPQPTPATDLYAFALVALEMVTLVQVRTTMSDVAWRGDRTITLPDSTPAKQVFHRALDNNPALRFHSATEFLSALQFSGRANATQPASGQGTSGASVGRKVLAVLGAVVLVSIAGLGVNRIISSPQTSAWDAQNAVVASSFNALVGARAGAPGWRDTTCTSSEPEAEQLAKITCRSDQLVYSIADYGSAASRQEAFPVSGGDNLSNGTCTIRSSRIDDNTFAIVTEGDELSRFGLLLTGPQAEQLHLSMPVC